MIKTPIGYIMTEERNDNEFPSVNIWLCDEHGKKQEIIAFTEYNSTTNSITTYSYKEGEQDFDKRCVFKRGGKE